MNKFKSGNKVKVISNYIPWSMLQGSFVNAEIGDVGIVFSYVEGSVKVLLEEKEVYFNEDMLELVAP